MTRERIVPCPVCGCSHASDMARAVGRFRSSGPAGYRAASGGPLRATRPEAEADECRSMADVWLPKLRGMAT